MAYSTFDPKPLLIGCSEEEGEFHIMDNGKPICGCRIDDLDTTMGTVEDVECKACLSLAPQTAIKWANKDLAGKADVQRKPPTQRRLFGKETVFLEHNRISDEPDYYDPMTA